MLFVLSYEVASQGGKTMGGGIRQVEAANKRDAQAIAAYDLRLIFGAPRARVTFTRVEPPAPQCPTCAHWHRPGETCAGCGCRAGF